MKTVCRHRGTEGESEEKGFEEIDNEELCTERPYDRPISDMWVFREDNRLLLHKALATSLNLHLPSP